MLSLSVDAAVDVLKVRDARMTRMARIARMARMARIARISTIARIPVFALHRNLLCLRKIPQGN